MFEGFVIQKLFPAKPKAQKKKLGYMLKLENEDKENNKIEKSPDFRKPYLLPLRHSFNDGARSKAGLNHPNAWATARRQVGTSIILKEFLWP